MNRLYQWASRGLLPPEQVETLGRQLGLLPDVRRTLAWLERALLIGAVLLLGAGLIFFIAANWSGLDRFARFALAQFAVASGAAVYLYFGDQLRGRLGLVFCVLAIGALFALYGQTYQTGADPWQLFATWAALALPLVWLARMAPLWLFWLLLVNLAVLRWLVVNDLELTWLKEGEVLAWTMVLIQSSALVFSEWRAPQVPRYARQLLFLSVLVPLTLLAFLAIIDNELEQNAAAILGWLAVAAGSLRWYRGARLDLLPLAAAALSAVGLATTLLARIFDDWDNPLVWLILAVSCIGMTAGVGKWLLGRYRAQQSEAV